MGLAQSIKKNFSKGISLWEQRGGPEKDQEFCAMLLHLWDILSWGDGMALQPQSLFEHHHSPILSGLPLLGFLLQFPQDRYLLKLVFIYAVMVHQPAVG